MRIVIHYTWPSGILGPAPPAVESWKLAMAATSTTRDARRNLSACVTSFFGSTFFFFLSFTGSIPAALSAFFFACADTSQLYICMPAIDIDLLCSLTCAALRFSISCVMHLNTHHHNQSLRISLILGPLSLSFALGLRV